MAEPGLDGSMSVEDETVPYFGVTVRIEHWCVAGGAHR